MPEYERVSPMEHYAPERPVPKARNHRPEYRPPRMPHQPSHPVQIPSATCEHRGPAQVNSRTPLLSNAATSPPIPSYATIEPNVFVPDLAAGPPVSATKPPSYNPRWERLPGYRDATGVPARGSSGDLPVNLRATPPAYWATYGAHGGIVPFATGSGAMFFNSPFQHYRMLEEPDVERSEARGRDRICGMRANRADVVINLSLLTICVLIWTAVVFSLSLAEPRQGGKGNVPPSVVQPYSDDYERPVADWDLGMDESETVRWG
ncbi:hypothetical protein QFC22_001823 [Naganishia vaughanmartiniae]|uniref:Uncharacterized protein n=1 Tax=Naganishia vaughanmartiniae TaxID=1424756 RepID=A0ACC2XG79_9TREE|nr:hypothetical protein QFC22_001823 [Naganishia vaughanmartiniae]